jgi:hypothetical protein
LNTTDTTITDTGLKPSHTYTYKVILTGQVVTTQATTMDTTSHNITWTTYTLGDGSGSSTLYDVAIINDTLAYAVGEIHSGGTTYNLAKWNGSQWTLSVTSDSGYLYGVIYCIYAFGPNDVWVGSSILEHWDGTKWTFYGSTRGYSNAFWIRKIWGTSSNDLYFVGDGGNIRHYDGTSWTKIESGTSMDIRSIWGAKNKQTGNYEIYATAGDPLASRDRKILHINGTTAESISDNGITWALNCVWFSPGRCYWLVGDGVWEKHPSLSNSTWNAQNISDYDINSIRGTDINDIVICGSYGEVMHYNGASWKSYRSVTGLSGGLYYSVAITNTMVCAVGTNSPNAAILIGKR